MSCSMTGMPEEACLAEIDEYYYVAGLPDEVTITHEMNDATGRDVKPVTTKIVLAQVGLRIECGDVVIRIDYTKGDVIYQVRRDCKDGFEVAGVVNV